MPIVEYLDYQIPVTHYVGVPRLSDKLYSRVPRLSDPRYEYLEYEIPVTQLMSKRKMEICKQQSEIETYPRSQYGYVGGRQI